MEKNSFWSLTTIDHHFIFISFHVYKIVTGWTVILATKQLKQWPNDLLPLLGWCQFCSSSSNYELQFFSYIWMTTSHKYYEDW